METISAKKVCKMCCMEISKDARKCPHCHHFQTRLAMVLYHPAFAVLSVTIPLTVGWIAIAMIFDPGEKFEVYTGQVTIIKSEIAFGETKSGKTVDVIGTVKNGSPIPWREIQFHVDFLNGSEKPTDVGHKEMYSFYLPANGTSSFKLSFPLEFPQTNYAKSVIRIVTAKDARARW